MGVIFGEITVVICLAAFLALIFRLLKQPPILAYILTGIIVGPLAVINIHSQDILQMLGELGITLLLFMLGLEIRIRDFSSIGRITIVIGAGQILSSFLLGYILSLILGFTILSSYYIAIALTFSSTVIVVKLLSDKKDLHSLFGKITLGVLLIQDFLAILVLIFLSTLTSQHGSILHIENLVLAVIKAVALFGFIIFLSRNIFPKLFEALSKSSEILFLISIAWVFGLAAIISSPFMGFSVEIGGFLAGLALSNSFVNYQIIAKAKVLRDFFIILFFVVLGTKISLGNLSSIWIPVVFMSLFVLIVKPYLVMAIMGTMGFRRRTSFLTGISLAQISEFSLIVVFLGEKVGHIANNVVSTITLVGIITFVFSTYLIAAGNKLYLTFGKYLLPMERKNAKQDEIIQSDNLGNLKDHIVVVGGDQMGESIINALENSGSDIVVIDFDPSIVKKLKDKKVHRLFGDISDLEIQEKAQLNSARLVISTIPDVEDNILLLKGLNRENRRAKVVVMALESYDAKMLYKEGADYVVLPHLAGGRQIARYLKKNQLEEIFDLKEEDLVYL